MKKSNELILIVALFVASFVVPALRAQDNPGGDRPRRGPDMAKMADELGLSDAQKTQFKSVMKESMEAGKAIREDSSLSPEDKQQKMMANRKATEEKIKAILTPEQLAKRKELMGAHGGAPEGAGPGAKKHKKGQGSE